MVLVMCEVGLKITGFYKSVGCNIGYIPVVAPVCPVSRGSQNLKRWPEYCQTESLLQSRTTPHDRVITIAFTPGKRGASLRWPEYCQTESLLQSRTTPHDRVITIAFTPGKRGASLIWCIGKKYQ